VGLPLALLFDEGYHSHSFYQFEMAERWLERADLLVFVGTSFAQVRFTHVALQHARQHNLPVYNINVNDTLESTAVLNASNILGSAHEILPQLVQACQALSSQQHPK
jgi:NAD-dependent SIR2 family protein deacetylase